MTRVPIGTLAKKARLAALLRASEPRVVSQQWATDDLWSPEPFWFERHGYSRGRPVKKQPPPKKDAHQYSYDASGEVVRIRKWSGFLGKWHEEEIFVPEPAGSKKGPRGRVLLRYRFRTSGGITLLNVERYEHDAAGRLVFHEIWFAEAKRSASQTFRWKGDQLIAVDVKDWGASYALAWDDLGRLATIHEVWPKRPKERALVYRRPEKDETLPSLLAIVAERLRVSVPLAAARARPKARAYALAIVFDEEDWRNALPPSLAMGFEDDHRRFARAEPERLRDFLWNPAELPTYDVPALALRDAVLDKAASRANQQIAAGAKHAKVERLVRDLAAELNRLDWSKIRPVTEDFVVYATSVERDGWRDVRRDAPAAIRARLIGRKEI